MEIGMRFKTLHLIPTFVNSTSTDTSNTSVDSTSTDTSEKSVDSTRKNSLKKAKEPIGIENVSVDFHISRYARHQSRTVNEHEVIESNWNERTSNNCRIFNASKFRLSGIQFQARSTNKLELKVGLTSYKELLGTHYSQVTNELVKEAKAVADSNLESRDGIFKDYRYMSNAIGVGAICETKDEFIVLMLRSHWTGEGAGKIDRPGGHPEPLEALKSMQSSGSPDHISEENANFDDLYALLSPKEILKEIFTSPQKELRDEINIELEVQHEPKLLGEILVLDHGGRVGLDFLIKVDLTKAEVLERYQKGHQSEADESTDLVFISLDQVDAWNFDDSFLAQLTPHCLGGLRLYHIFRSSS